MHFFFGTGLWAKYSFQNSWFKVGWNVIDIFSKARDMELLYSVSTNTYLLLAECEVPYGKLWTEFFPSFYGPSAKRAGHENKEGKNEDP